MMTELLQKLKNQFNIKQIDSVVDNEHFLTVRKEDTLHLLSHLKQYEGYTHLILLTAVDWLEDNKFQLTYLINNPATRSQLGIRTFIERSVWPEESEMQTAHHLWPAIKTYQRELHEMFGIDFPNSPEINDPLILEYWDDIPPYRRDFDTKKYAEETFFPREGRETNDPSGYMKEKLYLDEGKK
jgi:NADH-quinone oxidoreductase subunit C